MKMTSLASGDRVVVRHDGKDYTETIDHPVHYGGDTVYECIKVIEAWQLDFCLGNAVKYINRAGKKGDILEDLRKARWYIDRALKERGDDDCALFEPLKAAVRALYYAGVWSCDRDVDEGALWLAVREAAGFEPGKSPAPVSKPRAFYTGRDQGRREVRNRLEKLIDELVDRCKYWRSRARAAEGQLKHGAA